MLRKWSATILALFLAVLCITFIAGVQPAGAAGSYSIEMGAAQEYGVGGEYNNFWDLQTNISVTHTSGEAFNLFGNLNPRIIYKGGEEDGGFMDGGKMDKPTGQQVLQFTPEALAYNGTQYISQGHLYILRTQTLGYFALYVDDFKVIRDEPYMDFTLYKLKGAPEKVSSQPPSQPGNNLPSQGTTDPSKSGRTTITYTDGAVYTGEVSGGKPDGAGTMTYTDGAEYRGEWKNGLPDGDGTKTYANGDKYIGSWRSGKKEGQGIYVWANGDKYDGEWKDGKRNGQGKLTMTSGKVQEGLWKDSVFAGASQVNQQPPVTTPATPTPGSPVVVLNGKKLTFDVPPVIENDRTMVPLRAIFEALGAVVSWDEATQTISATKGAIQITLQVGGQTAYKNGSAVSLDVPAKVIQNRTLVPLRFVSEALGAKVGWDESTQTVAITPGAVETPAISTPEAPVNTAASSEPYWVESGVRLVRGGKVIYEDQDSIYHPFISPDGNWLVYSHNTDSLIMVNLADGSAQTIYQLEGDKGIDYGLFPQGWSADGSRIMFMTFYKGGFVGGNELMILDKVSGNTSLVIKGLSSAAWSKDGKIVMAMPGVMKVIDEAGRTIKELTVPKGGAFVSADHPSFTPDGQKVVYDLSGDQYIHDIATDTYKKIFSIDESGYARVGNDGRIIYVDKGKLYVYDPVKELSGVLYDKADCSYPNWQ